MGEPADDDILHQLMTGKLRQDDPAVQRRFTEDQELRAAWVCMRDVTAQLDDAGVHAREVLESADALPDDVMSRLDVQLQGQLVDLGLAPRRFGTSWWLGVAVAAALALVSSVWFSSGKEPLSGDPGAVTLGAQPGLVSPDDESSDYRVFRWTVVGDSFRITIHDLHDGNKIAGPFYCKEPVFRPKSKAVGWPDEGIEWHLTAFGPDDEPLGTTIAETWRRR